MVTIKSLQHYPLLYKEALKYKSFLKTEDDDIGSCFTFAQTTQGDLFWRYIFEDKIVKAMKLYPELFSIDTIYELW